MIMLVCTWHYSTTKIWRIFFYVRHSQGPSTDLHTDGSQTNQQDLSLVSRTWHSDLLPNTSVTFTFESWLIPNGKTHPRWSDRRVHAWPRTCSPWKGNIFRPRWENNHSPLQSSKHICMRKGVTYISGSLNHMSNWISTLPFLPDDKNIEYWLSTKRRPLLLKWLNY